VESCRWWRWWRRWWWQRDAGTRWWGWGCATVRPAGEQRGGKQAAAVRQADECVCVCVCVERERGRATRGKGKAMFFAECPLTSTLQRLFNIFLKKLSSVARSTLDKAFFAECLPLTLDQVYFHSFLFFTPLFVVCSYTM
jgi:hypothetical protein